MLFRRERARPSLNHSSFHFTVTVAVSSSSDGHPAVDTPHGAIRTFNANRRLGAATAGNHPPTTKRNHIGAGAHILGCGRGGFLDRADCRGLQHWLAPLTGGSLSEKSLQLLSEYSLIPNRSAVYSGSLAVKSDLLDEDRRDSRIKFHQGGFSDAPTL